MSRRLAFVVVATVLIGALTEAALPTASSAPVLPLGIPLPSNPTLGDILSTSNQSGDGTGLLPGAGLCNSAASEPIMFPADDGPHNNATFEWWFWNGHLITPDGHRWAFIVYFMARGPLGVQGVDYTLLDVTDERFRYGRRALILGSPGGSGNGLSLHAGQVSAVGRNGDDRVSLQLGRYQLNVMLRANKRQALLLDHGAGTFYCDSSNYYARTRMAVTGTLTGPGVDTRVSGLGWFDHQWGFLPGLFAARWQYLQFQLGDGRDIFLGNLTAPQDSHDFHEVLGIISDREGNVTTLHHGDFSITPTGYWRRDASCRYPVDLTVIVKGERFNVHPSIRNSELRAIGSPAALALWPENPVYWDGETTITGRQTGRGWLDLAKYCPA